MKLTDEERTLLVSLEMEKAHQFLDQASLKTQIMTIYNIFPKTALLAVLCVLLAAPSTVFSQQKPDVPKVHNKKLDEKFLNFCETDDDKKAINDFMSNAYNKYGSYLGSVTIQQNLDFNAFLSFLEGDIEILKNFEGEYRVTSKSSSQGSYYDVAKKYYTPEVQVQLADLNSKVGEWVNTNYFNIYSNVFSSDHPSDYDEMTQMFNNFFSSIDNYEFSPGSKMFKDINLNYINNGIKEEMENGKGSDIQNKMDMFAVQINDADHLLFWNLSKLFYDPPSNKKLYKLYDIFMQAVEPKFD